MQQGQILLVMMKRILQEHSDLYLTVKKSRRISNDRLLQIFGNRLDLLISVTVEKRRRGKVMGGRTIIHVAHLAKRYYIVLFVIDSTGECFCLNDDDNGLTQLYNGNDCS